MFDRRAVAAVAALLTAMIPAAASGNPPPPKETLVATGIACDMPLTSGDSTAFLFSAEVSDELGAFAELVIWADGTDPNLNPTHAADVAAATGTVSETGISIEVPLVETATGDPAGTAVITATLVPAGPERHVNDVFRFGNTFERYIGRVQDFTVTSGTLTALGATYDLTDCIGYFHDLMRLASNPDAFVNQFSSFSVSCGWPEEDPIRFLFGSGSRDGGFIEIFFEDLMLGGAIETDVSPRGLAAEVPLQTFAGAESPYVAAVDATFEPSGVVETETLIFQGGIEKSTITYYTVEGALSIADLDLRLDMSECTAHASETRIRATSPEGPKGKPPANDAVGGAVALDRGDEERTLTTGARFEPEVEASCLTDDGTAFWGRTVWYSIEGDGGEVTVDTAGSSFDTALAVYEVDGDTLNEIACVDDVPTGEITRTLQASATFDTEPGVVYLVQVGGLVQFAGVAAEGGRLMLTVE